MVLKDDKWRNIVRRERVEDVIRETGGVDNLQVSGRRNEDVVFGAQHRKANFLLRYFRSRVAAELLGD